MKRILLPMAMCLLTGAIGTSCQDDKQTEIGSVTMQTRDVMFSFSTKALTQVTTRSQTAAEENRIANVTLYGLDASGNVVKTFEITDATSAVKIAVPVGITNFYAVANVADAEPTNLEQLQALTFDATEMPASPFAMAGAVSINGINADVVLTRSVAKIEILGQDGFTVSSVAVKNTPNQGIITTVANTVSENADMVDYADAVGNIVYVAESKSTSPIKLLVKGDLNGTTTAYTVDLKVNSENVNVTRNTCYQVNITPISDTECDVNVTIPEWDEVTGDVNYLPNFGSYYTVDFHQHTTFTDGSQPLLHVMNKSQEYGIDININSGHGGKYNRNGSTGLTDATGATREGSPTWIVSGVLSSEILGDVVGSGDNQSMWRWQALRDYVFPEIQEFNAAGNSTLAVLGYEWNPPGHEHCSTGIITEQFDAENPNANALAQFEYMFDNSDTDVTGGAAQGWVKSTATDKEKSKEAAAWMQKNHRYTSWMVPAHPERKDKWHIEDYRNLNTIAPDVFVAFESIPGHQTSTSRGGIGNTSSYEKSYTYGGAGIQSAQIGGVWDALISEGRRFWLVANSDYHNTVQNGGGDFYPGEYQKTYISMKDKSAQSFVNGLRSGNIFTAHGDLIDRLEFSAGSATMGQTYSVEAGKSVRIRILVNDPQGSNFNTYSEYTTPELNHIDLIAGEMRDRVAQGSTEYTNPSYDKVNVIARFDAVGGVTDSNNVTSIKWEDLGGGLKLVEYDVTVDKDTYFRLRGTNHTLNAEGETDGAGNPLEDVATANTALQAVEAFSDLWFYSNPVYVSVK